MTFLNGAEQGLNNCVFLADEGGFIWLRTQMGMVVIAIKSVMFCAYLPWGNCKSKHYIKDCEYWLYKCFDIAY